MPRRNYMATADYVEEISAGKTVPDGERLRLYSRYIEARRLQSTCSRSLIGALLGSARAPPPPPPRTHTHTEAYHAHRTPTPHAHPPPGVLTYADLDMIPAKITEGTAMEPIRYSRVGGYAHGDTRKLAQKLPPGVKRYYGMEHEFDTK